MHPSGRVAFLIVALALSPLLASCGSGSGQSRSQLLDRTAWLGSPEGWGLLGLPLQGGPVAYRRAEDLEAPTWAPAELGKSMAAWSDENAVWVQFADSRVVRYDYQTGHLLNFGRVPNVGRAAPLSSGGLVMAATERSLRLVGGAAAWNSELDGRLVRLEPAGGDMILAVIEVGGEHELVVLRPPRAEPLGRRRVPRVRDLVVAPWGNRVYYLPEGGESAVVHGLGLPELAEDMAAPLPEPGTALAFTPSGHRLYVAAGRKLYVIQPSSGKTVRTLALPAPATALRFAVNGANLMARLQDPTAVAVLQVGVDSVLGVIPVTWDAHLPVIVPGGRLLASANGGLVLYDLPRLLEIARVEIREPRVWLVVDWQPPRPRPEFARSESRGPAPVAAGGAGASREAEPGDVGVDSAAAPGYYAVVLAAREREGVIGLVRWLHGVGYPATVNRHEDVMGAVWYRAMVGPYADRPAAEASAQSLSARYGYKPWILSVSGSGSGRPATRDSAGNRGDAALPVEEDGAFESDGRRAVTGTGRMGEWTSSS